MVLGIVTQIMVGVAWVVFNRMPKYTTKFYYYKAEYLRTEAESDFK